MNSNKLGNLEKYSKEHRRTYNDQKWAKLIKEKYNYTCQICHSTGKKMVAHHLENYNINPIHRTDIANGVCLCLTCHDDFHTLYGWAKTTRKQFAHFKKLNVPNLLEKYADRKIVRIDFIKAIEEQRIEKRIYKSIRHAAGKNDKDKKAIIYCCLDLWTCYNSPKDLFKISFWQFYDENLIEIERKISKISQKIGSPAVIHMGKKPSFNFKSNKENMSKSISDIDGNSFHFKMPGL